MNEHGTPLPNEMIVLSSMSGLTFCFVPVVGKEDSKKIVRLIVAPIIFDNHKYDTVSMGSSLRSQISRARQVHALNDASDEIRDETTETTPRLGWPYVFDDETVDQNSVARAFIGMDSGRPWKDKGYELDFTVEPREPVVTRFGAYRTYGLQLIFGYATIGFYNPPSAMAYIRERQVVERFDYIDYAKTFDFGYPFPADNTSYWGIVDYFVDVDYIIPPDSHDEYEFCEALENYILHELPYDQTIYLTLFVNCRYLWGDFYDDSTTWVGWYGGGVGGGNGGGVGSGSIPGSGSGEVPPLGDPPPTPPGCGQCGCTTEDCDCAMCGDCPYTPISSISVEVSASGTASLGTSYTVSVKKNPSFATENLANIFYMVSSDGDSDAMCGDMTTSTNITYDVKTLETHRFRVVATIDGRDGLVESPYSAPVTHVFPSVSEIAANPTVVRKMDSLWNETISNPLYSGIDVSISGTRAYTTELGVWIYYNTETGKYEFGELIKGARLNSTGMTGEYGNDIDSGGRPADLVAPMRYAVAFFHTHPAMHNYQYGMGIERVVGLSGKDQNLAVWNQAPVIAYDYVATMPNRIGEPIVTPETAQNAGAQAYLSNFTRRPN